MKNFAKSRFSELRHNAVQDSKIHARIHEPMRTYRGMTEYQNQQLCTCHFLARGINPRAKWALTLEIVRLYMPTFPDPLEHFPGFRTWVARVVGTLQKSDFDTKTNRRLSRLSFGMVDLGKSLLVLRSGQVFDLSQVSVPNITKFCVC